MISRDTIQRGFPIKPLGDIADFLDSRRRPITASERIPGPYPYYGANGQQDSVADYIFDEPLILLAEDGGLFDQPDRGIAYVIEGKTWVNNHAHVLRPRGHARLRYLVRVLENYDVTPWITGSTRAKLTKAGASKIQIPLPPLAEQKRIAGILDAADALRAKRRDALAQLDTLIHTTFLDMFGDPVTNPMGWEVRELNKTKSRVQIGPFGSLLHKEDYIVDGVPLVNPMHIVSGQIHVGNEQTVSEQKAATLSNYRLQTGDVIMGRRGEMGRCAIVSDTEAGMLCGTGSLFIRPHLDELSSLFLARTFSSESMKRLLEGLSQGVTMPNLNRSMIEGLKIELPPLDLQRGFSAIVESIEQQKTSQRAHLAELDTLFASLQSRAFRGDL